MKKKFVVSIFLLLVSLGFFSFVQYRTLLKDEEEFARYVLIREMGMYTLVGSKPMSELYIERNIASAINAAANTHAVQRFSNAEVEATEDNHFAMETVPYLWERWQKRHKMSSKKYALIKIARENGDELYFINKSLVRQTLAQYYALFVKQVGTNFSIDEVMATIDDITSFFWQQILSIDHLNPISAGLFFGYGLENATYFAEAQKSLPPADPLFSVPFVEIMKARWKKYVSLKELPLPIFRVFSTADSQVELYQKEREQICKNYQNADLRKLLIEAFIS